MRNGPNISVTLTLPLNSDVLVWREKEPYWSGPYKLMAIEGYTCKVQVNNKVIDFRVTSVRPYKSNEKEELPEDPLPNDKHPRRILPSVEIPSLRSNPADAITKATPNQALECMVSTNRLEIGIQGYIERPDMGI